VKVGLSYNRCIVDILDGQVQERDVLVIVTRTKFDPHNDQQWADIYGGYWQAWSKSNYTESDYRDLTIRMYDNGQIHQPRLFDAGRRHLGRQIIGPGTHWRDHVLIPEDLDQHTAARDAWEHFRVLASLSSIPVKIS
jgi:hypothetical protein